MCLCFEVVHNLQLCFLKLCSCEICLGDISCMELFYHRGQNFSSLTSS